VPKPAVGAPSQAADLGRAASGGKPNWDDYMTPDEMDEFEQWQAEQEQIDGAEAAAAAAAQQGRYSQGEGDAVDACVCRADLPSSSTSRVSLAHSSHTGLCGRRECLMLMLKCCASFNQVGNGGLDSKA
jgi:hypothetical protein